MTTTPSPAPLSAAECGVLGLCELPKGHDGMHSTSVDRAADLDATHGYMVFEGPNGELMRTPYRAARATLDAARTPRETPPDLEGLRAAANDLLVELNSWEREWLTSGTGYGAVRVSKVALRAALHPEAESPEPREEPTNAD